MQIALDNRNAVPYSLAIRSIVTALAGDSKMQVYKTHSDAALYIGQRISSKFWTGRVSDMLRHTCLVKSNDGSTALPMHTVKVDRIAKQWPLAGSISVSRDDGRKFRLRMVDKQFKVEAR